mmetsp:Transcript_16720/g.27129  ORF Transcript_16720/g.27129 Transcript_16720/m.27129 type:complete len:336 (-) Transcript_16720:240-1247(-)
MSSQSLLLFVVWTLLLCSSVTTVLSFSTTSALAGQGGLVSSRTSTVVHKALIYGWDDYNEEDSNTNKKPQQPKPVALDTSTSGTGLLTEPASTSCEQPSDGVLQGMPPDRLARLAFAFRPREHSGLKLQDIEHVQIICVHPHSIEMEAILCESLGCVSLHIPIAFPSSCDNDGSFQTCVLQNLQDLDDSATTQVTAALSSSSPTFLQQQQELQSNILDDYPSWWSHASSPSSLETEGQTLQEILNEDEFAPELLALAQEALSKQQQPSTISKIQKARCARVGPSGMAIKAIVEIEQQTQVVNVFVPFGGTTSHQTAEGLRAAVLGAIAAVGTTSS